MENFTLRDKMGDYLFEYPSSVLSHINVKEAILNSPINATVASESTSSRHFGAEQYQISSV
jgi:hypothetical protein